MSRISRREYLKQMGFVGGMLSTAKLGHFINGEKRKRRANEKSRTTNLRWRWPSTPIEPGNKNLTMVFQGLMGFSNINSDGEMEIGFNKGKGKHKLQINLFLQGSDLSCYELPSIHSDEIKKKKEIRLYLKHQPAAVNAFHREDFNRMSGHIQDFAWLLDFEDELFYPSGVKVKAKKLSPVLFVKQATFYTHQLSKSTFYRVGPSNADKKDLGRVPRLMGANVDIPVGGRAVLEIDKEVVTELPYIKDFRYQVQFVNDCFESSTKKCHWLYPKHDDEEKRNDFYMHYYAFDKSSSTKYGIMAKDQVYYPTLEMCGHGGGEKILEEAEGTDQAPCMGAGFGQTGGFPS